MTATISFPRIRIFGEDPKNAYTTKTVVVCKRANHNRFFIQYGQYSFPNTGGIDVSLYTRPFQAA